MTASVGTRSRATAPTPPCSAWRRRGPWPPFHPVVVRTVERTIERLESGRLLYRLPATVDDGRAGPDNPDLLASLWGVRALARLERWEEAHERMEAVLALAGPVGLLSEAADPTSGELLGNLPSTAVHLAVIDAATALAAGPR
jgi:GH15 family glucan-1,4-alpha-glucosidase